MVSLEDVLVNDYGVMPFLDAATVHVLGSVSRSVLASLRENDYFREKPGMLVQEMTALAYELQEYTQRLLECENDEQALTEAERKRSFSFDDDMEIYNISHAGAMEYALPNTIPAFLKAQELGAHVIELDVQVCKSGDVIVYHDLFLPNGLLTAESTLRTVRKYAPYVPTINEVLDRIPSSLIIYFDMKGHNCLKPLLAVLEQYVCNRRWHPSHFWIAAFDHRYLSELQDYRKQHEHMAEVKSIALFDCIPVNLAEPFAALEVSFLSTTFGCCAPDLVADAKARGIQVFVWTINNPRLMEKLFSMGVKGIVTDYPDRLVHSLRTYSSLASQPIVMQSTPLPASYVYSFYPETVNDLRHRLLQSLSEADRLSLASTRLGVHAGKTEELQESMSKVQHNMLESLRPLLLRKRTFEKVIKDFRGFGGSMFSKEIAKSLNHLTATHHVFDFERMWLHSLFANSPTSVSQE